MRWPPKRRDRRTRRSHFFRVDTHQWGGMMTCRHSFAGSRGTCKVSSRSGGAMGTSHQPFRRTLRSSRAGGRCLRCTLMKKVDLFVPGAGPRGAYRDHGGIVIPALHRRNTGQAPFHAIVLPLKPVWPAFAGNSLLFAGLLAIPVCLLLWARLIALRRRVRRGWCPQCGYNLRSNYADGCSECGWKRAANTMPST